MNGGKRPGAGRKKGFKFPYTRSKEEAREAARKMIMAKLGPMIESQVAHAIGISHFFLRDPITKQFVRIEDPVQIEEALNAGEEGSYYWIFTKDPSVPAFTDLMNRALDKPAEQVRLAGNEGGPLELTFRWKSLPAEPPE